MSDQSRSGTAGRPPVLVEQVGSVLLVTLNRPSAMNALNADVAQLVAGAMDMLDSTPQLRAGVLTGAGGNFSAGMDLKAFVAGESPFIEGRGLCGITVTPPRKPLLAAVEGWALAGGFELLLACDIVVAGHGARVGVPEVKRGLVAAGGGALLLAGRIPLAIAMELLLTGEPVSATRAAEVGLLNRVTADGDALETAMGIARQIAENGPLAVELSKQIARGQLPIGSDWDHHDALAVRALKSEDAVEGATAFAERRRPVWQGR